jgi:hypothetical protein
MIEAVAQPGIAADRFAHEIVRILKASRARSRQLNAKPLGGVSSNQFSLENHNISNDILRFVSALKLRYHVFGYAALRH